MTVYLVTVYLVTVYLVTVYLVTVYLVTVYLVTVYLVTVYLVTVYLVTVYLVTVYDRIWSLSCHTYHISHRVYMVMADPNHNKVVLKAKCYFCTSERMRLAPTCKAHLQRI